MLWEIEASALVERDVPRATGIGRRQPVWRDLSLVVRDEVTHDRLMTALRRAGGPVLAHATLFDVYRPDRPVDGIAAGEHSVALRLELQDDAAALTDERVSGIVQGIVDHLRGAEGARLRG